MSSSSPPTRIAKCPSLVVRTTPDQGRGIFYDPQDENAGSSLKQGSTILRTTPIVASLTTENAKTHCARCFSKAPSDKELKRCGGCKFARYCSAVCQKADWIDTHSYECKPAKLWNDHSRKAMENLRAQVIAQGISPDNVELPTAADYPSALIRTCFKLFCKKGAMSEKHEGAIAFNELEGHNQKQFKSQSSLQQIQEDGLKVGTYLSYLVAGPLPSNPPADLLIQRLKPLGIGDRELADTLCKHLINRSTVMSPTGNHLGPYHAPVLEMLNHSCEPNVCVVMPNALVGPDPLHLVALRDIKPGEQLTITYMDLSMPYEARAYRLKTDYFLECQCPTCTKVRTVHKRILKSDKAAPGRPIDPREALRCQDRTCAGWRDKPPTFCKSSSVELYCSQCNAVSTINASALNRELDAAENKLRATTAEVNSSTHEELLQKWEKIVKPNCVRILSIVPPSAYPIFPLFHWVQQWLTGMYHYVPDELLDEAGVPMNKIAYTCAQLSFLQVSAIKAGGEFLYGKANPNRAWLILGLVKWLLVAEENHGQPEEASGELSLLAPAMAKEVDQSSTSGNLPLLPVLPPMGIQRAKWALELLDEGLETCRLAFGEEAWKEDGGGLKEEFQRQRREIEDWEQQWKDAAAEQSM